MLECNECGHKELLDSEFKINDRCPESNNTTPCCGYLLEVINAEV